MRAVVVMSNLYFRVCRSCVISRLRWLIFFYNDPAPTEIYTLSLHDALPISTFPSEKNLSSWVGACPGDNERDRKSTRLNSSHEWISYAVFCLKKKNGDLEQMPRDQILEALAHAAAARPGIAAVRAHGQDCDR